MSIIVDHGWLIGVALAIGGAILILLGGRCLVVAASWLQMRASARAGRTIKWEDAISRCKAETAVIVVELKSRPRKVWFLKGSDESAFFSRKENPRAKGLLVIDPPDGKRIHEQVEEVGGRVVEVDMNGTFW